MKTNLGAVRKNAGYTQEAAAEKIGVSPSTLRKWEQGVNEPDIETIIAFADLYGVTTDTIMGTQFADRSIPGVVPTPIYSYAPLVGRIAAGTPLEAIELDGEPQWVEPSVMEAHPEGFFLRVSGDSMNLRYPEGGMVYVDPKEREIESGRCYAVLVNGDEHPEGFFLRVSGDSMNLRYPEGGMVYVDPKEREIESGRCYAVLVNGDDATLKQVFAGGDTVILHPLSSNPEHRDRSIDTSDPDAPFFSVVGRVCWYVGQIE